ncbi:MAG: HDIG domain-containing protein [Saprospiraceae bacterium]|nr:HDIG domain-containing protein [Saprospiraceae bacterium]
MSKWNNIKAQLPNITRYLIILGVIAFISFLFPKSLQFKYEFERGQTWRHEEVIAPFDFAIKKTQAEMDSAVEQLSAEFPPYYEMNLDIVKEQKRTFAKAFGQQLNATKNDEQFQDVKVRPDRYLNYGNDFLDRIYDHGIIQLSPAHDGKSKDFVFNLLKNNASQPQTLEYFYTLNSVKSLLTDSLPYSQLQEPDFLYPLLENAIQPNVFYNADITSKFLNEALAKISTTRGLVKQGDIIIARGNVVTDEIFQQLISLKEQYELDVTTRRSSWLVFVGYFLLTTLIVGIFSIYLSMFANKVFRKHKELFFILLWLLIYGYLVFAVEKTDALNAYMIPFCIVPIVIRTFYNNQLAIFTHISVVLIASFLSSLGYEFTLLQILAGIVVLLSDINTRNWSQFFSSMLYIFLTYALAFLGLSLIQEGSVQGIDGSVFTAIFINSFLTMLAYPLIPLLERLFGFTSHITLMELTDMNRPLLRELSIKAPGTLQHSMQVANLSEAAARKIEADSLLVKVGALYHDVGKAKNPGFFVENQNGNNPHENKSPLESAKLIIEHVPEGIAMAKKHRLPSVVIDFIRTHHGTTRVEYFYRNYINVNPEIKVDETDFRYPGPKPRSKEEAILMMADSIEAACKSLKNPTETQINEMIDKIVTGKISNGQLDDSKISFREVEICKKEFKKFMKSVHHARIEYPEEKKTQETSIMEDK